MINGPSWEQLEVAADNTQKKIIRSLQIAPFKANPYSEFVELVETALNWSIRRMVGQKNVIAGKGGKNRMDEDQLTLTLALPLLGMAFDIEHSTNRGGNCDIVIKGSDDMLWLGEAKIYTSYVKLMGGFQQLCDRYASGMDDQLHGGMIIYMFKEKTATIMNSWCEYLQDVREGLKSEVVDGHAPQFRTTEAHGATEKPFVVRHMPVPLFHEPTDPKPPPPRKR